jgi:RNA polymerase sigma factor (sigma-70 family)
MGSPLDAQLRSYSRLPIPTRDEQVLLGRAVRAWLDWEPSPDDIAAGRTEVPARLRRAGRRARDQLVSRNMLLVARQAAAFSVGSLVALDRQDLIQEGAIGLCRAAEMFDPSRGCTFSTFAVWWIRQSITRLVHTSGSIRIPVKRSQAMHQLRQWVEAFTVREGRSPSDAEAMAALDLTPADLRILRQAAAIRHVGSLDAAMGDDDGDCWGSTVAAPGADPADPTGGDLVLEMLRPWPDLQEVMNRLLSGQSYGQISGDMRITLREARRLGREGRAMACRLIHDAAQMDQATGHCDSPVHKGAEMDVSAIAAISPPASTGQQLTLDLWSACA